MSNISIRDPEGDTKAKISDLKELKHPGNKFHRRSESFIGLYFINSPESINDVHEEIMKLKDS